MEQFYLTIYRLPYVVTILLLLALTLGWKQACAFLRSTSVRIRFRLQIGLGFLLLLWLLAVLYTTILSRTSGKLEVHPELFYYLRQYLATGNRDLLRSPWMNILLFVPGGLLLQTLLPQHWSWSRRLLLTVLTLGLFSCAIEAVQYRNALGVAETDDVLCNVLGVLLGAGMQELKLE